jgi:hypothetical protein
MGKAKIEIRVSKSWEIYLIQDGKEKLVQYAPSKVEAKRRAKILGDEYGPSKRSRRKRKLEEETD